MKRWIVKTSNTLYGDTFEFEYLEDASNFIRKFEESRVGIGELVFNLTRKEYEENIEQESESVCDTDEG